MIGLQRKAWVIIAENQLEKRLAIFGEEAKTCKGCKEILICSGPISFQVCQTVDELMETGQLKGPRKIYPFKRTRQKFLPIDEECLEKYGFLVKEGKLAKAL